MKHKKSEIVKSGDLQIICFRNTKDTEFELTLGFLSKGEFIGTELVVMFP
jgi:hypothetical protein